MFRYKADYAIVSLLLAITCFVVFLYSEHLNTADHLKTNFQIKIENISNKWNDLFYKKNSDLKTKDNVVLVVADEPSLIEIGRWPWSRDTFSKITENLFHFNVKTLAYDIYFSENEKYSNGDKVFSETVKNKTDKIIFGTFSEVPLLIKRPYQDYCLTQAFLYTGGASLVKINPFLSVDEEANAYEELDFGVSLNPIFKIVDFQSEIIFLKEHNLKSLADLSPFQKNTLDYYKQQQTYSYCLDWLTEKDGFKYKDIPEIEQGYQKTFKVTELSKLDDAIDTFKRTAKNYQIPQYILWKQNISLLQEVAQYTASTVAHPDFDGVVRNYPLVFRTGNQLGTSYIPSLALQSYLTATGYQALFKLVEKNNNKIVSQVEIIDVSQEKPTTIAILPVDEKGKLLIKYYGPQNTLPYVSAKDILNDSETLRYRFWKNENDKDGFVENIVNKADYLKDKNIIFGATALGVYDIRNTPIDINYPGPEIHATVLTNLINQQYLSYVKVNSTVVTLLAALFFFVTLIYFIKLEIMFATALFVAEIILTLAVTQLLFLKGYVLQISFLMLVLIFGNYFITMMFKYFFQTKKSKEIKQAFSKYVSKDVVEEILRNASAIELRGQKLNMSVYFSDIRGFTEFSEKMDPVELSEMLNKYFTPMSAIITENRGTIDKYIGDAIMAMFGAPINYENHAEKACEAALSCIEALKKINLDFADRKWPHINIGIGINTGYMNAGNIGSDTIQNYTVIGDSVNLASRLEGLNKQYGTQIIISQFTYEIVKEKFNCKELDTVQVKGKKDSVKIYELVSRK